MRNILSVFLFILLPIHSNAFSHKVMSDNIESLQVWAGINMMSLPVIGLNSGDVINIAFDDLTHVAHRYTYSITHCEADWSESEELFASDYIEGFQNGLTIDDYEESINTNVLYTHYHLKIPNDRCRIKMSGNYRLDVIDDDTRDTMFSARFMVTEKIVMIDSQIVYNTDIDVRKAHQQMELGVSYPNSLMVNDARRQFKVAVVQNRRWDDVRWCPDAPILRNGVMEWTHVKNLIFPAGNEYHKFEILDPHRNSMGVEQVTWDGEMFNIHLYHDYPRKAYVYDEDVNGGYVIRNSDNIDVNTTSDYVLVHFYYDSPRLNGDLYVDGQWAMPQFGDRYLMEYDEEGKCYHVSVPMKLGYYNYQYLLLNSDVQGKGIPSLTRETEGDFYQTENAYSVFVYYRKQGDRTWRLVGVKER